MSIDICYCDKLFLSFLFLFRVFFVWCNKVIFFVLMFGTQYYFCSMFCTENWSVLWTSKHTTQLVFLRSLLKAIFLWQDVYAIDCVVKLLFWKCTLVFLYILVFALYVRNRKNFVTARHNWGDVHLLSRVGYWLMLRKNVLCSNYKHFEDMIRIVDVGFFWHNTSTNQLSRITDFLLCWKHVMQLFMLQRVTVALCVSSACVTFFFAWDKFAF